MRELSTMLAAIFKQDTVGGEAEAVRGEAPAKAGPEQADRNVDMDSLPQPVPGQKEHEQNPVARAPTPKLGSIVELHGLVDKPDFN